MLRLPSTLPSPFQFSRVVALGHLLDSGGELRQDVSIVLGLCASLWPPCHPGFILRSLDRLHFPNEAVGLSLESSAQPGVPAWAVPFAVPYAHRLAVAVGQAPICALNE